MLYYRSQRMQRLAQLPLAGIGNNPSTGSFPLSLLNFGRFAAELGCYSPPDVIEAHRLFNANCGPASFAAVCRTAVTEVMPLFPQFPSRDWTTVGDMRRALQAALLNYSDTRTALPEYGIALLQLRVNDRPLHRLYLEANALGWRLPGVLLRRELGRLAANSALEGTRSSTPEIWDSASL